MLDMRASWAMAGLAAHVPLRYLFGVNVVINGVASVARRSGGTLHIVRGIKCRPPVGSIGHEIRAPNVVRHIPLRWFRKIVVSSFREVALFPNAAVNQGDRLFRESSNVVRGKIGNNGVRKLARIANHIRHRRFSPVLINLRMARLARSRANVMSRTRDRYLLFLFFGG